jgi:activator of HSP90 ATPase
MAFSQSPAEVTPEVGGSFSMFGGSVQGKFTELVPGEKIVQQWRFSNWEDGKFSNVSSRCS